MAYLSIKTRTLANKELRFKAVVIVKSNSVIIHRESKTFKKKELAKTWSKNKTPELKKFGINKSQSYSIEKLLDFYMNGKHLWDNTGRIKQYVIRC